MNIKNEFKKWLKEYEEEIKMNEEEKRVYESIKVIHSYMKKMNYVSMPFAIMDPETNKVRHLHIHIESDDPKYKKMAETRRRNAEIRKERLSK